MKDKILRFLQMLPKNNHVYLSLPELSDRKNFLREVECSRKLHYPWVYPLSNIQEYNRYVGHIDCVSHISFFIKTTKENRLAGVINISEIVKKGFQSGYLGFYAFEKSHKQGFISQGLSLVLYFWFYQLKFHRLEANIQPQNKESIQLIKSKNF